MIIVAYRNCYEVVRTHNMATHEHPTDSVVVGEYTFWEWQVTASRSGTGCYR
jgi:hypothetical protein